MRALMGLIKDRHGTYYARHKVPERLQEAVARILDNGKARQAWLKKSLGTKVVAQANVRAKPVQMEFDRIIARAEAQLKERPVRTSLTAIEIKRIADFFYAQSLLSMKSVGSRAEATIRCSSVSTRNCEAGRTRRGTSEAVDMNRRAFATHDGEHRERHRVCARGDAKTNSRAVTSGTCGVMSTNS